MESDKLSLKDIEIKSPGLQVKEAILRIKYNVDIKKVNIRVVSKYLSMFADEIGYYPQSMKQCLKDSASVKISEPFKEKLRKNLNIGYDDIVLSDRQQIEKYANTIYENYKIYGDGNDFEMLNKVRLLCSEHKLIILIAKICRVIAYNLYTSKKPIIQSCEYLHHAISILIENCNDIECIIDCYSDLGLYYFLESKHELAEEVFLKAFELIYQVKYDIDKDILYYLYYRRGILYSELNKLDLAKQMFFEALKYSDSSVEKGKTLMNIGIAYKKEKQYKEAIKYYDEALKYVIDKYSQSIIYNNKAELYKKLDDLDKAEQYIRMALECIKDCEDDIKYLIYSLTSIEIDYKKGYREKAIDSIKRILYDDKYTHKKYVLLSIDTILDIAIKNNDTTILRYIEKALIIKLKKYNSDNTFSGDLKQRYADLYLYYNHGGDFFEKEVI